jgi:hypothetical protein
MLLNKLTIGIVVLQLFGGINSALQAQGEKESLRAMYTTYGELNSLQMNINLQLFTKSSDTKPMQESSGKVCKEGVNYYSEMLGRVTVINKSCCVLVDNGNKVIVYSEPEGKIKEDKNKKSEVLPDSVLFNKGTLRTISNSNDEHCIEIKFDSDPQYDRIEVTVNTKDHTLRKIVYYFKPYQGKAPAFEKMVVVYSGIQLNTDVQDAIFSESAFVSVSKDRVSARDRYNSYQVIDQRVYNKQAQ